MPVTALPLHCILFLARRGFGCVIDRFLILAIDSQSGLASSSWVWLHVRSATRKVTPPTLHLNMLLSLAIWGCLLSQAIADPESILGVPGASLDILSSSEFARFDHSAFPAHGLRIKKTEGFCDSTVNTYTGYLDTNYGTKHLFFYFFESRNDPKNDDVIMWINGGPGGASEIGAFMELGARWSVTRLSMLLTVL